MKKGFFAVLFIFVILFSSFTEDYLRLLSPNNGWSSKRHIIISGETSINKDWLLIYYNSIPFYVPVKNGRFSRQFLTFSGLNNIFVEVETENRILKDNVVFYSKTPPIKMRLILIWDTDGTHVDLWITEPNGELCKWNHKTTKSGGVLDIGDDYPGYGPQIYTHAQPPRGNYKIQVHYYSSKDLPHTFGKIYLLLNEGTPNEEIREYEVTLTRPGQMFNVENIFIE